MSKELKPCPFCGSSAKIVHTWRNTNEIAIVCSGDRLSSKSFGCPASNDEQDEQGGFSFSCYGEKYLDELIEIWNSRPIEYKLQTENETLKETLELLQNWINAYPLDVFPQPDLKLARKLLTDGGVSYDALNAHSMRHVINGVGNIIDKALNEVKK